MITFDPTGAYGLPDHIAICQFGTVAITSAADATYPVAGTDEHSPHRVSRGAPVVGQPGSFRL